MIDLGHFRDLVIDPAIDSIGLYSEEASELLLGTALQESQLTFLTQLDGDDDPHDNAMGVFQTERKTIIDIWAHYLRYKTDLAEKVLIAIGHIAAPAPEEVITNLRYAAIMARLHYRRVREPLPDVGDLIGQATYWKNHYNTHEGAGTISQYIRSARAINGEQQ